MSVLLGAARLRKERARRRRRQPVRVPGARDATKPDIKAAVELMFEVKVAAVKVVNAAGKQKRFGQRLGPPSGFQEGVCAARCRARPSIWLAPKLAR